MSLRSKIVLILVTVVVAYAALDNTTNRLFSEPFFGRMERRTAAKSLAQVNGRIESEIADLRGKGRLLAGLREVERFACGENPAFAEANLNRAAMERAEVDLLYICDNDGRVLWGRVLDPETRQPKRMLEFPSESLSSENPAIHFGKENEVSGVLMTHDGHPLLLSSVPIPDLDGREFVVDLEGRKRLARGAVIFGRFLAAGLKQSIIDEELELTGTGASEGLAVEVLDSRGPTLPAELGADPEIVDVFQDDEDGRLHAYRRIASLRTAAPLVLHVALFDRATQAQQRSSVEYALVTTLIGGLLILLVLLRLLQGIVVKPLSTLTRKAVEIGKHDDTSLRVGMQRQDEIGQLAGEFDSMLDKLQQSREQVVKTARLAGMSEIATGVLHNVGNVLNSVNVAANLATRKTEDLSLQDLEMIVSVLQSHEEDLGAFLAKDPRGKHLVPFMAELSAALSSQRVAIQGELGSLNQGIEHIAELVRAQQSFAGTPGVFERAALDVQVEAALAICRQGLATIPELELVREFETLPSVSVDKHKLMEILVNLIQNAGQAVSASKGGHGRLTLRIARHDERTARIEVRDTGIGIAPEDLTRVFNHGFTTKKSGHGFGLHVSANAATEMGARLHAESEGPGHGAAFFLDIPLQEEPALALA
jgi:signal transduction histidine kinase/sensor domain CHASE-containing protein